MYRKQPPLRLNALYCIIRTVGHISAQAMIGGSVLQNFIVSMFNSRRYSTFCRNCKTNILKISINLLICILINSVPKTQKTNSFFWTSCTFLPDALRKKSEQNTLYFNSVIRPRGHETYRYSSSFLILLSLTFTLVFISYKKVRLSLKMMSSSKFYIWPRLVIYK